MDDFGTNEGGAAEQFPRGAFGRIEENSTMNFGAGNCSKHSSTSAIASRQDFPGTQFNSQKAFDCREN
jgi:hypothetical protein